MKLRDYALYIEHLAKNYPDAEVVSASDDEGNSFSSVKYAPTVGIFDETAQAFESDGDWDTYKYVNRMEKTPNAVCIN